MKKKTIQLSKLTLNKERIANLDKINGGGFTEIATQVSNCGFCPTAIYCGSDRCPNTESQDLAHCQTNKYVSDIHGGPCTGCNGVCK